MKGHKLTSTIEEEKKVLAPLLGKLYVSPTSTETKICETYQEVSTAVDNKLIADATGRNALYKIHVSLGKIVNGLAEKEKAGGRKSVFGQSLRSSVGTDDDKTVMEDDDKMERATRKKSVEKEEPEAEEGDGDVTTKKRDSLVEDLLSDDEETIS